MEFSGPSPNPRPTQVRFRLAKNVSEDGSFDEWPRLTASTEPVKNHRVWWEGQEQIVAEEKKVRGRVRVRVRVRFRV